MLRGQLFDVHWIKCSINKNAPIWYWSVFVLADFRVREKMPQLGVCDWVAALYGRPGQ